MCMGDSISSFESVFSTQSSHINLHKRHQRVAISSNWLFMRHHLIVSQHERHTTSQLPSCCFVPMAQASFQCWSSIGLVIGASSWGCFSTSAAYHTSIAIVFFCFAMMQFCFNCCNVWLVFRCRSC